MANTDEQYIQKMYDKQKEATLNTLKTAYDSNVSAIDTAQRDADKSAYEAKRETVGDAALTKQRLNEAFAANGLNTGTAGQAQLALQNQRAANLNKIENERVAAQADFSAQKAQLEQAYQAEVKSAVLNNDAERAAALYELYKEQSTQQRAEARQMVADMLSAGKMPSQELINTAELPKEYIDAQMSSAIGNMDTASVQQYLNQQGYALSVDGVWGPQTEKAYKAVFGSPSGRQTGSYGTSSSSGTSSDAVENVTDNKRELLTRFNNGELTPVEYLTLNAILDGRMQSEKYNGRSGGF